MMPIFIIIDLEHMGIGSVMSVLQVLHCTRTGQLLEIIVLLDNNTICLFIFYFIAHFV